jgi:hypothetical protein
MFNFQNLLFNHNKEKATHSIIPSKYPERKNIPFFDTVRELCDNSVDANSTLINIVVDKNEIFIIDNGIGMNKDVLNNSLIAGNSGKTNKTNTLGKFGIGLNQSISQFNKDAKITQAHFLSLTWDTYFDKPTLSYIKISPEEINKNIEKYGIIDGWKIEPAIDLYRTEKNEIQRYLTNLSSKYIWEDGPFQSGTIVGIVKTSIPELRTNNFEKLSNELSCHLGMAYYQLLKDKKIKINIIHKTNIVPVHPIDLLLRNEKNVDVILQKEYSHPKCHSKLKTTIVVTPKDSAFQKPNKDELTDNSPYIINNVLNGIALQHNGVIVKNGLKRIPITESLAEKIRATQKQYNLNTVGTLRKELWWNTNDSYSSPIRVLLEINSEWHINNLIRLDQEKTSFEFHEDIEDILADIYLELNKAYNYCKEKNDKKHNPPITQTSTPTPTPTKTTSYNPPIKTHAPPTIKTNPTPTPPTPQLTTIKKTSPDREEWIKLSHEIARSYNEEIRSQLFDFSQKLYNKIYID